ncbi:MAG TPA: hypothetical protein VFI02_19010, partial [Armatimonadota bacterium]|nr:hypothetical protein [Armatimonadota bacterium]
MASDYAAIKEENFARYGWDIDRVGKTYLAHQYSDRTHFIFELLQNAEDALARRRGWKGQRGIRFELSKTSLRVSHFGERFDTEDVRGICGIGQSTKALTDIGRFGIGFKSVYAYTDRPEVYSRDERFAVESFVCPVGIPVAGGEPDETVFVLPLRINDR